MNDAGARTFIVEIVRNAGMGDLPANLKTDREEKGM